MDAVKAFNSELSSLYDVKPPISKAKMTAITRGAIKAIKFYKHVVQSVEKFILKCKAEYKVPGLYVIDSIVRQSRHQFGPDKDVFAPRFAKNLQQTFVNLFKCPAEDKSKIIRVLNLWQKNQVFQAEDIQPLFDLADPNNPIYQQLEQQQLAAAAQQQQQQQQTNGGNFSAKGSPALPRTPTRSNQSADGVAANSNLTEPVLQQLQNLQRLLTAKGGDIAGRADQIHFDKKLLDFDYGEDEEDGNPSPRVTTAQPNETFSNLLTNPEVLRQLQNLQNTIANAVPSSVQMDMDPEKIKKLQEMKMQEDEFDRHLAQTVPNLPFASECEFKPSSSQSSMIGAFQFIPPSNENSQMSQGFDMSSSGPPDNNSVFNNSSNSAIGNSNDVEVITLDHDDDLNTITIPPDRYEKRKRSRSKSRERRDGRDKTSDRDRDKRSRRSRSRSRSRRRRSRSREREKEKEKEKRERERKERDSEKDKERKKRGLPAIKKDNLSVCSTTLWVGHLSKLVHQDDLSNTFGEFGVVISIDLIPPRGCAFIVMDRRQDASRCLTKLKSHLLHGKAMTLAWAPGKGVKGKDLKDYWEGDLGVSYIPWNKIREDIDLELLEDGGVIDEDTMPGWMKAKMEDINSKKANATAAYLAMANSGRDASKDLPTAIDTSQPPPLTGTNILPPSVMPLMNPFQYSSRLLGLMPNLPIGVPPPNIPTSILPNINLGLNSPFQGILPPQLSNLETKPIMPPSADESLRTLSESLMSLSGQPLTLPPQPPLEEPQSIHNNNMEENMDVEMEDAGFNDRQFIDRGGPMKLNSLDKDFRRNSSDERRDSNRNDRMMMGRNRSRSRERDQFREDLRERDTYRGGNREPDFHRNRSRDDRSRGRQWDNLNRRPFDRKEPDIRHTGFFDERKNRENALNDRLIEMAGINFNSAAARERLSDIFNNSGMINNDMGMLPQQEDEMPNEIDEMGNDEPFPLRFESPPCDVDQNRFEGMPAGPSPPVMAFKSYMEAQKFGFGKGGNSHGLNNQGRVNIGPSSLSGLNRPPSLLMDDIPFGNNGQNCNVMDMLDSGSERSDFGGSNFDSLRFSRGGRRGGRRGMMRRDGPDFESRGSHAMRGMPDFGPRGPMMRGRGFFGPRIPRVRGAGPSFREAPIGFNAGFDPPPDPFFRGPRGLLRMPFEDPFFKNRAMRYRGGRGGRPAAGLDGAPNSSTFGEGPPGIENPGTDADGETSKLSRRRRNVGRWDRGDSPEKTIPQISVSENLETNERNEVEIANCASGITEDDVQKNLSPIDKNNGNSTPLRDESADDGLDADYTSNSLENVAEQEYVESEQTNQEPQQEQQETVVPIEMDGSNNAIELSE